MRPPSVDSLARSLRDTGLPHPILVDAARAAIDDLRGQADTNEADFELAARRQAERWERQLLRDVINATGVLLHTNLGRAPYGASLDSRYRTIEFDLATGERGSRQAAVGALFADLCGAEAALVVNNCAAAVTLTLAALAEDAGVVVSRGELVEIGGGFRIPEVLAQSGAYLVEVGTTNRTRKADYLRALDAGGANGAPSVAAVLKVHQSNYRVMGFTEETSVGELTGLGVPLLADIGSGLLDASCPWLPDGPPSWLADEPAARQTLAAGADLVMFSGDKLLGGPQAGVIAGKKELVQRCARHPLARAVRVGGLVLMELQRLALAYSNRSGQDIPLWEMATRTVADLTTRAEALGVGTVSEMASVPGGGTLPGVEIPSAGVVLDGDHAAALRSAPIPIVARVAHGQTFIDLRTVSPDDDELVRDAIVAAMHAASDGTPAPTP